MINGVKSATSNVLSGVPQGSVIGPLLFSIYVNDLPSVVSSQVLLFADDVKLFCPIVNQQSNFQLEQDLLLLIKRMVNEVVAEFQHCLRHLLCIWVTLTHVIYILYGWTTPTGSIRT